MGKIIKLLCFICVFCCNAYAQDRAAQSVIKTGVPQIMFVNGDSVYDFGGIPRGSTVEYQFVIKNTGDEPLLITGVSCGSANVKCRWPGKSIKHGKKGAIAVSYTANSEEGSFRNDVIITSNLTQAPYAFIHITGAITPAGGDYVPSSKPSSKSGSRRGR